MQAMTRPGYRLSPQQRRLWLLEQRYRGAAFVSQCAASITAGLDRERIREALERVVARHEILRTSFERQPGLRLPLQVIAEEGLEWIEGEARRAREGGGERSIEGLMEQEREAVRRRGEGIRARVERIGGGEEVLVVSVRGMRGDGITVRRVIEEVEEEVEGRREEREVVQYADLSEFFNQLLEADDAESISGRRYWSERNAALSKALRLPFERRPEAPLFQPQSISSGFDPDVAAQIEALAHQHRSSPESVLLACWQVLLCRLTGEREIIVARSFDTRSYNELHGVLGPLTRYLPIPISFEDQDCLSGVLSKLDEAMRAALAFKDYFSWEQVAGRKQSADDLAYIPVCFEYIEWPDRIAGAGTALSLSHLYTCLERYKLRLCCIRRADTLLTEFHFDSSCFSTGDIERLAGYFHRLVKGATEHPETPAGQIELLSAEERHQLVVSLNRPATEYPRDVCLHRLFERQVERTPERIAAVFEREQLTYRELNARANQLARCLRRMGDGPEKRVAICLERSVEMIIAILGTLKAGGAYVPLDPVLPEARLTCMLEDAEVTAVITHSGLASSIGENRFQTLFLDTGWDVIGAQNSDNPVVQVSAANLAYVIYTSGSTGQPKGVAVEHRQISNYLHSIVEELRLPLEASYALVSTIAADLGHTVTFTSLCTGGTLHIISQEMASNPGMLADYFRRHSIDCLKIVPSHLRALIEASQSADLLPRQRLILGGEASGWDLIERLQSLAPGCKIFNHYGPTETTVGVLTFQVEQKQNRPASATVPLGRPIANIRIYLLDAHLQPVPTGVPGELFIGGDGLARGYLKRADLSAERFLPDPFGNEKGARLYRTGDLARYLPDGNIEFLGRLDHQVKIRGYRIELKEVEMALLQHQAIREAVVAAREDKSGNQRLIGYIVAERGQTPSHGDLRSYLQEKLPEYMIPSVFINLKALPLTPNGKLDRQALPDPDLYRTDLGRVYVAPRSETEQTIAEVWQQVLCLERVGLYDNFFDLGGHSLSMIQVHSRLQERFQKDVPIIELFKYTTVSSLARYLSEETNSATPLHKSKHRAEFRRAAIQQRRQFR